MKITENTSESLPNAHVIKIHVERMPLISAEITRILHWLLYGILCQAIVIFGVVSNAINMICFFKQGFRDPVNVSLFGMYGVKIVNGLFHLTAKQQDSFQDAELAFDPFELQYLTGGYVLTAFSRITSWITAIITLERCLCITIPLK
ncbi:unnamed protein product, partial [Candidula unifasciata]